MDEELRRECDMFLPKWTTLEGLVKRLGVQTAAGRGLTAQQVRERRLAFEKALVVLSDAENG